MMMIFEVNPFGVTDRSRFDKVAQNGLLRTFHIDLEQIDAGRQK